MVIRSLVPANKQNDMADDLACWGNKEGNQPRFLDLDFPGFRGGFELATLLGLSLCFYVFFATNFLP
jgi:hypothetical protein